MASSLSFSPETTAQDSRKTSRRTRRRREQQDSVAKSTTNLPSTPKNNKQTDDYSHEQSKEATTSSNIATNGSATFEEGEDFIPFAISDLSDDEPGPSRRRRTERSDERGRGLSERQATSNDLNEVPTPESVERKSKIPGSEREWDRGKEAVTDDKYGRNGHRRDHKRKYDEYDKGYSKQRQRLEVGSRKCPWVANLDLNRCLNVAEMWVEWYSFWGFFNNFFSYIRFHREVESFVDWISPSPVEDEVRGLIVTQVTQIVSATFPDAHVFPFGSYQTKLYLPMG